MTKTRNAWLITGLMLAAACGDDAAGDDFAADAESAQASPEAGQATSSRADAGSIVDAAQPPGQSLDAGLPVGRMELDAASSLDAKIIDANQPVRVDASADASAGDAGIAVSGRWHSSFGGTEVIDSTQWSFTSIVEYDNQTRYAVTQNPANDMFNPSKYNKYVWTPIQDGSFYYCTVDYGLDSAQAARTSAKQADATDPDNAGCSGFSWTKLSPAIEIDATWKRTDATLLTVDSDAFGDAEIVSYDNASNSAVLRSKLGGAGDAGAAAEFAKVVWSEPTASSLSICFVERGLASAEAARSSTRQADPTSPTTGCVGAAWTVLSR